MKAYCYTCQADRGVTPAYRRINYVEPEKHCTEEYTDLVCDVCTGAVVFFSGHVNFELNDFARQVHKANQHWWHDPETGAPLTPNFGEKIALCHSELSEALEGHRKDLMDDKLPNRKMVEVELVDCLIRIFDLAGAKGFDLQGAYEEKMAFNAARADHKPENRVKPGGKAY